MCVLVHATEYQSAHSTSEVRTIICVKWGHFGLFGGSGLVFRVEVLSLKLSL